MNTKCASTTVELLAPIWERVLRRPSIGINDNFFRAGGNLVTADLLFAEIARELGREFPSAVIFQAPTIATLASVLEQTSVPRLSPFVQLKVGREKPPIFIAPNLDGRASFSRLAACIQTDHSIYGIQAKGLDGMEEPLDRIEDMAQFYLDSIDELQSEGPYILIGYSFGGLVALEMAQRLSHKGRNVGLLVLVESYPHSRYLSLGQRITLSAKRVRGHMANMKQMPAGHAVSYVMGGIKPRLRRVGVHSTHLSNPSCLSLERTTLRVKDKSYVAMAHYRPRPYGGKINFVKSKSESFFPRDPLPVWTRLAAALQVETVPGSHLGMVTVHAESLAAVLTGYVREALRQE